MRSLFLNCSSVVRPNLHKVNLKKMKYDDSVVRSYIKNCPQPFHINAGRTNSYLGGFDLSPLTFIVNAGAKLVATGADLGVVVVRKGAQVFAESAKTVINFGGKVNIKNVHGLTLNVVPKKH